MNSSNNTDQQPSGVVPVELHRVIEQLPLAEKAAYLQAKKKCPHLVAIESNPQSFLRAHQGNVWRAAQCLVEFWQMRLEIFGPERAFRPLNDLSGQTGALDEEALAALGAGSHVILPNSKNGHPVVYVDATMANPGLSYEACMRSTYFLVSLIWRSSPIVHEDGYIAVVLNNEAHMAMNLSPAFMLWNRAMNSFPARIKAIYVLKESAGTESLQSNVRSVVQIQQRDNAEMVSKINPIVAPSHEEMAQKLEVFGLHASGLPTSIGGTWEHATFDRWFETIRTNAEPSRRTATDATSYVSIPYPSATTSCRDGPQSACALKIDSTLPLNTTQMPESTKLLDEHLDLEQVDDRSHATKPSQDEQVTMMLESIEYIDYAEKEAYMQAMERVPWLVEAESNPKRFLRCENYDPWAAARRLLRYWYHRKRIFGENNAFRPLHQTVESSSAAGGSTALTKADVKLVQSGYHTILPVDQNSRSVLWIDQSKIPPQEGDDDDTRFSNDSCPMPILRSLFYALQVVSDNEQSQKRGCACLILNDSHRLSSGAVPAPVSAAVVEIGNDLIETAMPIRSVDLHLLCPTWLSECADVESSSSPCIMAESVLLFQPKRPTIHKSQTKQAMISAMESVGVKGEGLPAEVGGIWTEYDSAQWHADRIRMELKRQEQHTAYLSTQRKVPPRSSLDAIKVPTDSAQEESEAMARFQRALDRIPQSHKEAYLLAMENVPDLVRHESPPMRFLKHSNYNSSAAARRLVAYWESRYTLFGEKAFLPMNLTGRGALSESEINELIASGFIAALPNNRQGQSVLFINKKRIPLQEMSESGASSPGGNPVPELAAKLQSRAFFYWMHVMSENPKSQTQGLFLVLLWGPPFPLQANCRLEMDLLAEVIPVRLNSNRILCRSRDMESVFPRLIHALRSSVVEKTFVHAAEASDDFLPNLRQLGLERAGIPAEVGGEWHYESHFADWLVGRKKFEHEYQREFLSVHPNIEHLLSMCDKQKKDSTRTKDESAVARVRKVEMTDRCLSALENFVNLLPDASKAPYLDAMEHAPRLVAKESDSIRFLKACKYDPMVAAKRLTAYWEKRKQIFKERCLCPLNQTDEGALANGDIGLLNTGYCCLLPNDTKGRPVICIDESRNKTKQLVGNMPRVSFYVGSVLAENEMAQDDGCVVLVILNKMPKEREPFFALENALPLRVRQVHFVVTPPAKIESITSLEEWVQRNFGSRATVHVGKGTDELASKLEACGLEKENFPSSLGGSWSYVQFVQWLDIRTRLEWELPMGLSQKGTLGYSDSNSSSSVRRRIKNTEELSGAERTERDRRLNLLHSRRKRIKHKFTVEEIERQVANLRSSKEIVVEENERLEGLMKDANDIVTKHVKEVGQGVLAGPTDGDTNRDEYDDAPCGNGTLDDIESRGAEISSNTQANRTAMGSGDTLIQTGLSSANERRAALENAVAATPRPNNDPFVGSVSTANQKRPSLPNANQGYGTSADDLAPTGGQQLIGGPPLKTALETPLGHQHAGNALAAMNLAMQAPEGSFPSHHQATSMPFSLPAPGLPSHLQQQANALFSPSIQYQQVPSLMPQQQQQPHGLFGPSLQQHGVPSSIPLQEHPVLSLEQRLLLVQQNDLLVRQKTFLQTTQSVGGDPIMELALQRAQRQAAIELAGQQQQRKQQHQTGGLPLGRVPQQGDISLQDCGAPHGGRLLGQQMGGGAGISSRPVPMQRLPGGGGGGGGGGLSSHLPMRGLPGGPPGMGSLDAALQHSILGGANVGPRLQADHNNPVTADLQPRHDVYLQMLSTLASGRAEAESGDEEMKHG